MFTKLLKEPIIHFVIIAAILLWLHAFIWPEQSNNNELEILVERNDLALFLQSQTGVTDEQRLSAALDGMPDDKKQQLIERYFRQQALYREALKLGLDKNDPAIQRRLIQRISLIAEPLSPPAKPSDAVLRDFFAQNAQKYAIEASITLSHIFFKSASEQNAERAAKRVLNTLQRDNVAFDRALQYGDRFLYHTNYVQRTPEFIAVHFDENFSQTVFADTVSLEQWQGPIQSQHGWHLVYISQRSPARDAEFEEVRGPVLLDYQRQREAELKQENLDQLISDYQLVIDSDLQRTNRN